MLEIKGKLGSAREQVFKVFRSVGNLGSGDDNISLPAPALTVAPSKPANSLTNYSLEAELKRAEALTYLRTFDRPK